MSCHEETRTRVATQYARIVSSSQPLTGCCRHQKGTLVQQAGYSRNELDQLPEEAVVNSFGCGNPLAFSGVNTGDTVLDLGAGAGIDLILAAERVGPSGRVIGVDMTEEMLAKARQTITESGHTNIELRLGLIEEMPVESNSVDWVISNCVINLSPEKPRVFAEIHRVLKPGGRMIVSDIVAERLPPEVRSNPGCTTAALRVRSARRRTGLDWKQPV